jgi:heat shock protein HslJ
MRRAIASGLLLAALCSWGCAPPKTAASDGSPTAPTNAPKNKPGAATVVGTYSESADGAMFTHCATRARFPIAREGDFEVLANAYASVPHEPGAPVVVSLVGRLQPLPIVEGNPPRDQLIVDRLLRIWPDETCEKATVHTTLDNTYWKLVELNGKPFATHEDQREVHVILRADSNQVRGFAGCNPFEGQYEGKGTRLRFHSLAVAESACAYIDEEVAFIAALERVTNCQSLGESLDLRDDVRSIARLRAVYFK